MSIFLTGSIKVPKNIIEPNFDCNNALYSYASDSDLKSLEISAEYPVQIISYKTDNKNPRKQLEHFINCKHKIKYADFWSDIRKNTVKRHERTLRKLEEQETNQPAGNKIVTNPIPSNNTDENRTVVTQTTQGQLGSAINKNGEQFLVLPAGNNEQKLVNVTYSEVAGIISEEPDFVEGAYKSVEKYIDLNASLYDGEHVYEVNILVVYLSETIPKIELTYKDLLGWEEFLFLSVNNSFVRAGINGEVVAVGREIIDFEMEDWIKSVDQLALKDDGVLDIVHSWRDKYKADVVALIVDQPSHCGVAQNINAYPTEAFIIVNYNNCGLLHHTFAHELGHLAGARHNIEDDDKGTYEHGYRLEGKKQYRTWRSIMATKCREDLSAPCPRSPEWSSPDLFTYHGQAKGIKNKSNVVYVWQNRIGAVANFYEDLASSPPPRTAATRNNAMLAIMDE